MEKMSVRVPPRTCGISSIRSFMLPLVYEATPQMVSFAGAERTANSVDGPPASGDRRRLEPSPPRHARPRQVDV